MKKYFSLFVPIWVCCIGFSQTKDKNAIRFAKTITAEDAKKHLSILASDEYEGRETGKEGQKKAARYIAENFKQIGLKSATDETYLQTFPLTLNMPENAFLQVDETFFERDKDFYVFPYGENILLNEKNILFLGYGISDSLYNDYADSVIKGKEIDVKGKIVLILEGEPMLNDSVSLITGTKELSSWATSYRKKAELAKNKGAQVIIVVNTNFDNTIQALKSYLESPTLKLAYNEKYTEADNKDKKEATKKILRLGISEKTANQILASQKTTVKELKQKMHQLKYSVSFALKADFKLELKNKEAAISSENVLGVIEGSEFKDEVIFVTAHYDHLGVKNGKVFNGADDDGSGTVGVMEIAEAFAKAQKAGFTPKRTLVFMTVSGEEKGLLGSSYYTDNPIFPIPNTVCDLNIDMIGRIDANHKDSINYLYIIGSDKISTDLHTINENANTTYAALKLDYRYNDPKDPNRFYYRSDHYNFAQKGVPIIFYFNGVHDDYHEETDEISKINFDLLVQRTQLVFYTAWEVANRKNRIVSNILPPGKEEKITKKDEKK
jgi:hypothetical protein